MTLLVPAEPPPTTSERSTAPSSDFAPAEPGRAKTAWRMGGPMADNRIVATVKEFGSLINTILIVGALFGIVYKWGGETTRIDNKITAAAASFSASARPQCPMLNYRRSQPRIWRLDDDRDTLQAQRSNRSLRRAQGRAVHAARSIYRRVLAAEL